LSLNPGGAIRPHHQGRIGIRSPCRTHVQNCFGCSTCKIAQPGWLSYFAGQSSLLGVRIISCLVPEGNFVPTVRSFATSFPLSDRLQLRSHCPIVCNFVPTVRSFATSFPLSDRLNLLPLLSGCCPPTASSRPTRSMLIAASPLSSGHISQECTYTSVPARCTSRKA